MAHATAKAQSNHERSIPLRVEDLPPKEPVLSARQIEFLRVVCKYRIERLNYPTTEEIARLLQLKSRQGALAYIKALIKTGHLRREPGEKFRYIRLTDMALNALKREGVDTSGQLNFFEPESTARDSTR